MSGDVHVRFCESVGVRLPGATHLVILTRRHAAEARDGTRPVMACLRLTLNETKTKLKEARQESFDFLGYSVLQKYTD